MPQVDDTIEESAGTSQESSPETSTDSPEGDPEALGDAGKKALDAMKRERNAARREASEAAERAKDLEERLKEALPPDKVDEIVNTAKADWQKETYEKILTAEVKAEAASLGFSDPSDAIRFFDSEGIEADEQGNLPLDEIRSALTDLAEQKPYLLAQRSSVGNADQGARNGSVASDQLTREDMDSMQPEEIDAAFREGRFKNMLTGS